jgi:hypothetical protein
MTQLSIERTAIMSSQIAMAYDTVKPIDHTEFDPK